MSRWPLKDARATTRFSSASIIAWTGETQILVNFQKRELEKISRFLIYQLTLSVSVRMGAAFKSKFCHPEQGRNMLR